MDKVEWLEVMVDAAEEGLLVLGPAGEVVAVNRAATRLSSVRREAIMGRRASVLRACSDFPWPVATDAAETGKTVSAVHTVRNGAKLLITAKPVLSADGTLRAVVVTMQNVSPRSVA